MGETGELDKIRAEEEKKEKESIKVSPEMEIEEVKAEDETIKIEYP